MDALFPNLDVPLFMRSMKYNMNKQMEIEDEIIKCYERIETRYRRIAILEAQLRYKLDPFDIRCINDELKNISNEIKKIDAQKRILEKRSLISSKPKRTEMNILMSVLLSFASANTPGMRERMDRLESGGRIEDEENLLAPLPEIYESMYLDVLFYEP